MRCARRQDAFSNCPNAASRCWNVYLFIACIACGFTCVHIEKACALNEILEQKDFHTNIRTPAANTKS
jgi:hypothetical protein